MYSLIIFMVVISMLSQGVLLCMCDNSLSKRWYLPTKMIASTCFMICLVVAIYNKISGSIVVEDYVMLAAFVFCFFGDLFIGQYNQLGKRKYMTMGIVFFAVGHICFLILMYMLNLQLNIWLIVFPLLSVGFIAIVIRVFKLQVGKLLVPILIYSFFVSSLLFKSVYDAFVVADVSSILMGIGGVLFFTSDFLIIFLYFYNFSNFALRKMIHRFNLLTYYCAMLAFAISVLFR